MESEDLDGAKDQWLLVPAILPVKRERENDKWIQWLNSHEFHLPRTFPL